MIDVCIHLPLPPRGKGRPRAYSLGGKARLVTPGDTRAWETDLAMVARAHLPREVIDGPVRVDILAVVARPKTRLRRRDPDGLMWRTSKPDGDNVRKAVLDALRAFWRDDAQVVSGETLCAYAERDGRARTVVRIRTDVGAISEWAATLGLADAEQEGAA